MKLSAYAVQILSDARLIDLSELELHRMSWPVFSFAKSITYPILQALRNMKAGLSPPIRSPVE